MGIIFGEMASKRPKIKLILAEFKFGDWQSRTQIFITSLCFVRQKSAHIVRLKTQVGVMERFQLESCVRGHHIRLIQEYVGSVVGGSTSADSRSHIDATLA